MLPAEGRSASPVVADTGNTAGHWTTRTLDNTEPNVVISVLLLLRTSPLGSTMDVARTADPQDVGPGPNAGEVGSVQGVGRIDDSLLCAKLPMNETSLSSTFCGAELTPTISATARTKSARTHQAGSREYTNTTGPPCWRCSIEPKTRMVATTSSIGFSEKTEATLGSTIGVSCAGTRLALRVV